MQSIEFQDRLKAQWEADTATASADYAALCQAAAVDGLAEDTAAVVIITKAGRSLDNFLADTAVISGRHEKASKAAALPNLTTQHAELQTAVESHQAEFSTWFGAWSLKAKELQDQLQMVAGQLHDAETSQHDLIIGANTPELLAESERLLQVLIEHEHHAAAVAADIRDVSRLIESNLPANADANLPGRLSALQAEAIELQETILPAARAALDQHAKERLAQPTAWVPVL